MSVNSLSPMCLLFSSSSSKKGSPKIGPLRELRKRLRNQREGERVDLSEHTISPNDRYSNIKDVNTRYSYMQHHSMFVNLRARAY